MKRGPHSSDAGHPGPETLIDFVEERLAAGPGRRIAEHLYGCARCRAEAESWARLIGLMAGERADAPPRALAEWARRLPRHEAPARRAGLLRLLADSWAGLVEGFAAAASPLAPALRSASQRLYVGRRRLLFAEESFDVDVEIRYVSADDAREVHGQVLPRSGPRSAWEGTEVVLRSGGRIGGHVRLDRRAEFRFVAIPPARYRLEILSPRRAVTPPFEI